MISLLDIDIEKIENISKITLEDLKNPKVLGRLKELVVEVNTYGLLKEANYILHRLSRLLEKYKELGEAEPDLFKKYNRLIIYLKFLTLLSQPVVELEELFKKHLFLAFRKEISLKDRLNTLFLISDDDITGGNIRVAIIKAMQANHERLSNISFENRVSKSSQPAYIKNWLRDYYSFSGEKVRGKLEQITYLNKSDNVKKLNSQEKEILTKVIQLYDFLNFSPAGSGAKGTRHSLPTAAPAKPAVETGSQPASSAISNQDKEIEELRAALEKYPAGSLERKAIEEEIKRPRREA